MDQEFERDRERRSHQSCRVGFSLYGFSLTVSSLLSVIQLYLLFSGSRRNLIQILGINHFEMMFGAFRVWTRLIAALFLCAAFEDASWRRRSGLLALMAMADVVLWALEHGVALGLTSEPAGHDVLRINLYMALVWAKFSLIAGLAVHFTEHVGAFKLERLGGRARAMISTGAVVWFFYFLEQVDWSGAWPLTYRPMTRELFLFYLATMVMTCVCLVQTSMLCLIAGRSARHSLRERLNEDRSQNLWITPARGDSKQESSLAVGATNNRQKLA